MSAVKTLAWGIVAWAGLATVSQAAPLSFGGTMFSWTNYEGLAAGDPNVVTNASIQPAPAAVPAATPAVAPALETVAASAPLTTTATATTTAAAAPAQSGMVDAFLNFGSGPYAEASAITTGGAQSWYLSPGVANLFGGTPNAQQQQDFVNTVAQRVEQTFQLSGVPLTISTDPSVPAAHVLSVVSGTGSAFTTGAIGETDIGRNGFSFIDPIAGAAQNVNQLEWIVAHNISHELMLAFGVPEIHDQTGNYIDSTKANMAMMLSPTATFSPGAVQDLLSRNFLDAVPLGASQPQLVDPQPVPEPATLAVWGLVAMGAVVVGRRRARRVAA
ncbi:MAG: PEP-CTERM sorting domain-containing protein [Isosphaeraceae bacterium]|nr:PEP-CTERM sorting domain-containing protein [Isosphaeraceae bacterium]